MARHALIKAGKVVNIIEADAAFFDRADPKWLATFDSRVVCADTDRAEPGATYSGGVFTSPVRTEAAPVDTRVADLEAKVAALEARR